MRIGTSYKQHRDLAERMGRYRHRLGHRRSFRCGDHGQARRQASARTRAALHGRRFHTHVPQAGLRMGRRCSLHRRGGNIRERGCARRMFDFITDGELEWADMGDVYDRIILGERSYDFVKGFENFRRADCMHVYFPSDSRTRSTNTSRRSSPL